MGWELGMQVSYAVHFTSKAAREILILKKESDKHTVVLK